MADFTPDMITPDVEARFWAKVDRRGDDECWPWTASPKRVYGSFKIGRRMWIATHVALHLAGSHRKDRLFALHSCDNPRCCNPSHLRWGTDAENANDRNCRTRQARGVSHGSAKLTEDAVRQIRRDQRFYHVIAADFGVSRPVVSGIKSGKYWSHVC